MPEWGPSGSVRGAPGNKRPYRDRFLACFSYREEWSTYTNMIKS
jgi:hypothetical protein